MALPVAQYMFFQHFGHVMAAQVKNSWRVLTLAHLGMGQNQTTRNWTAGFGPWFHLPGQPILKSGRRWPIASLRCACGSSRRNSRLPNHKQNLNDFPEKQWISVGKKDTLVLLVGTTRGTLLVGKTEAPFSCWSRFLWGTLPQGKTLKKGHWATEKPICLKLVQAQVLSKLKGGAPQLFLLSRTAPY